MEKQSVVIIGGGLGGLFTGAILSRENFAVTILEKNPTVGGGLQSFKRFGEVFDTGMHIIGGMREGGNIRRICEYLGIADRVHIQNVGPEIIDSVYCAEDGINYDIGLGKEGFVNVLAEKFPEERENLRRYVDAIFSIADELDLFYLRPSKDYMTVHSDDFIIAADELIAKYIRDPRLRGILAYLNPLYSGRRGVTPAYMHSVISVLYINGPSRFVGGSQLFADTLRDFIVENGGEVVTSDGVSLVHSRERSVTGVTTCSGREYRADWYVSAIHPANFLRLLEDPTLFPRAYRTRLETIPNTISAFTLNLKLKPGTFRYIPRAQYYLSRYDKVWDCSDPESEWPVAFLYTTPPDFDQGEYSGKMIVTAPMTWNHVSRWEDTVLGHRTPEYEKWKTECAEKLLDRLEELHPDIRDCIEAVNTASPLTIRDWYGIDEGAMFGYSKDCNNILQSQVPVVTKASNLLLTGQSCNLHGFCGVPLTAINTCEAILGRNYIINKINDVR